MERLGKRRPWGGVLVCFLHHHLHPRGRTMSKAIAVENLPVMAFHDSLTDAQKESLIVLRGRWHKVGKPVFMVGGDGDVVVECFYPSGASMFVAIQPDGHRYS